MIYTVGLIEEYEKRIDDGTAIKLGRGKDGFGKPYAGGWVWKTPEDARRYLFERNSLSSRRVYGVIADWDRDTYIVPGAPTRCLKVNAKIVRLPGKSP